MRQSNAVRDMKGSAARRLLAAEEEAHAATRRELAVMQGYAEDRGHALAKAIAALEEEKAVSMGAVLVSKNLSDQLDALLREDARAVPYLMDMIAHLQGQIAALTGPDDPALDIEGPKDA